MRRKSGARSATGPAGPSQRQLRVAEEIRRTMVEILSRANFRDPDLVSATVTISGARISPGLKNVTIYATPLGGKREEEIIAALNRSRAYLRGELARSISIRHIPELRFELDRSFAEADHIERLLKSRAVRRDIVGDDEASGD